MSETLLLLYFIIFSLFWNSTIFLYHNFTSCLKLHNLIYICHIVTNVMNQIYLDWNKLQWIDLSYYHIEISGWVLIQCAVSSSMVKMTSAQWPEWLVAAAGWRGSLCQDRAGAVTGAGDINATTEHGAASATAQSVTYPAITTTETCNIIIRICKSDQKLKKK